MYVKEKKILIKIPDNSTSLIKYFEKEISSFFNSGETPIRFVISESDEKHYHSEIGFVTDNLTTNKYKINPIFKFNKRHFENSNRFITVLIIPTGIGAEIGGHSGDANPVTKLLSNVSDLLITHPNVVNAADINELPDKDLYVEGSILTQLLMGTISLKTVRSNKVIVIIGSNKENQINEDIINSVEAARATIGLNCPLILKIEDPITMSSDYASSGRAIGYIRELEKLLNKIYEHRSEIDAIALSTVIEIPENLDQNYFQSFGDIINPWGGVEAMLTHTISNIFALPSAHSPMVPNISEIKKHYGIVDPRMAAEVISVCCFHSVLMGLHKSPKIIKQSGIKKYPDTLDVSDISCLVIPDGCIGLPTLAALEQGIPVIAVKENKNCMKNDLCRLPFRDNKFYLVENYLEAAGIIASLKSGIDPVSVRRPLLNTKIVI